ncbi:MAG: hypothetical protein ACRDRA_01870 [Pseudonocardiaceae bacterium]
MGDTTTSPDKTLSWYLRSLSDHDTHHGSMREDGTIDAYLTFRQAWIDGATEGELADLATECRRGLPSPAPPAPAAMFIHRDILITSGQKALPAQLVTALWVPEQACIR